MKVLEKALTPNGVEIQLEEWDDRNEPGYSYMIGAYPVSMHSSAWKRKGEKFRLGISSNQYKNYTDEDILRDFEALKSGEKRLENLSDYFWNGKKDAYFLGMEVEYEEEERSL